MHTCCYSHNFTLSSPIIHTQSHTRAQLYALSYSHTHTHTLRALGALFPWCRWLGQACTPSPISMKTQLDHQLQVRAGAPQGPDTGVAMTTRQRRPQAAGAIPSRAVGPTCCDKCPFKREAGVSFCSPPDTLILDSCVQEHERLDLCLKPRWGLLSCWWPRAAHTSPDLAVRAGSLQCWSCPRPSGVAGVLCHPWQRRSAPGVWRGTAIASS